jgi:hypothetical protein
MKITTRTKYQRALRILKRTHKTNNCSIVQVEFFIQHRLAQNDTKPLMRRRPLALLPRSPPLERPPEAHAAARKVQLQGSLSPRHKYTGGTVSPVQFFYRQYWSHQDTCRAQGNRFILVECLARCLTTDARRHMPGSANGGCAS